MHSILICWEAYIYIWLHWTEIISGECSILVDAEKIRFAITKAVLKKDILSGITKAHQISESYVLHVGLILNTLVVSLP